MLLACGCATRPLVTVRPEPANHAWWVRASFDPQGRAVHGVPARTLHPGWCAADELTPARFAAFERADGRDPGAADSARYAVRGPGVDGRTTRVSLVVFRECKGATGTAFLLVDPLAEAERRVLAVQVVASPARYAMLDGGPAGRVRVVHCQECDAIDAYRWDPAARRWVDVPDPPEDDGQDPHAAPVGSRGGGFAG